MRGRAQAWVRRRPCAVEAESWSRQSSGWPGRGKESCCMYVCIYITYIYIYICIYIYIFFLCIGSWSRRSSDWAGSGKGFSCIHL